MIGTKENSFFVYNKLYIRKVFYFLLSNKLEIRKVFSFLPSKKLFIRKRLHFLVYNLLFTVKLKSSDIIMFMDTTIYIF